MIKVLFICQGNTCRSPMAEALFNHLQPDACYMAGSAGLGAVEGQAASPQAVAVMKELYGIDLSGHRSRPVDLELLKTARLILTMEERQKQQLLLLAPELADRIQKLTEAAGGLPDDVQDPFGCGLAQYRQTAATLKRLVRDFSERLLQNDDCRRKPDL